CRATTAASSANPNKNSTIEKTLWLQAGTSLLGQWLTGWYAHSSTRIPSPPYNLLFFLLVNNFLPLFCLLQRLWHWACYIRATGRCGTGRQRQLEDRARA